MHIFRAARRGTLAKKTLLAAGLAIASVTTVVTLAVYQHTNQTVSRRTLQYLQNYVNDRAERESDLFRLAVSSQEIIRAEYFRRLAAFQGNPKREFDKRYRLAPDGSYRLRRELLDTAHRATVYLSPSAELTDETMRQLLVADDLVNQFGPSQAGRFMNLYFIAEARYFAIYWPNNPVGELWEPSSDGEPLEFVEAGRPSVNPRRASAWTAVYADPVTRDLMVTCVTPVDRAGEWLGSIASDVPLTDLLARVRHDRMPGGQNLLVRRDGRIIVDSNTDLTADAERPRTLTESSDPAHRALARELKSFRGLDTVFDDRQGGHYIAVSNVAGPDWLFVTVYPKHLIAATAFDNSRFTLLFGLAALLVELGFLYWVVRRQIAEPLQEFIAATKRVKVGDLRTPLDVSRDDELGELAESFNDMIRAIASRDSALEAKNHSLREQSHRLTAAFDEARQSKEIAEMALKVKCEFLANMTHEVRTPLNGVLGMADVLNESGLTDTQREYVETIRESGSRLLNVLGDVLDLATLESGKLSLRERPFELSTTVERVMERHGVDARAKGLRLTWSVSAPLATGKVVGDAQRVSQVLHNVLSNAVKFTSVGAVSVSVFRRRDGVRFTVQDTGCGLEPEQCERAFDAFRQADASSTRKQGGTGLGLAITKHLVKLMGGQIALSSTPGQGTCVTIDLPLPPADEASRQAA